MLTRCSEEDAEVKKRKLLREYVISLKISESANRQTNGEHMIA